VRSVRGLFIGPAPSENATPVAVSDGQQLRVLRESAHVSQASLGAQLGVSRFLVNHWEAGRQSMPPWISPRLLEALEAAQHPAPSRRRRAVTRRRAVMEVIEASPGLTRRELRGRCRMTHEAVAQILEQLLQAGAIHETSTLCTLAAGQRFGVGVFLGPARPGPPSPTTHVLREAGQRAGWSQARIARALDLSPSAWSKRLARTPDQAMPGCIGPKANEVLQAMYEDGQRFEQDLLTAITKKPTTREQLTRGTYGRSVVVEETIDRLLSAGRMHRGYAQTINATGVARNVEVLCLGPAPAVEPILNPAELTDRRRHTGLSRAQFAARFGVSKAQMGYWEKGDQPTTGRAAELRALLDELGTAAVPHSDVVRSTDDELEQVTLDLLMETPGQTRRVLTAQMPGDVRRRHATVLRLVNSGRLVERTERRYRGDGHPFTAKVLYINTD
jgi:DNA-binding transcriptional regulator YiaG